MGHASQPAGVFTLRVNNRDALTFNVSLDDSSWQSSDGSVRATYEVMEANAEDSDGVFTIYARTNLVTPGSTTTFEISGSAAKSLRWFGIYEAPGQSGS